MILLATRRVENGVEHWTAVDHDYRVMTSPNGHTWTVETGDRANAAVSASPAVDALMSRPRG